MDYRYGILSLDVLNFITFRYYANVAFTLTINGNSHRINSHI